MYDDKNYKPVLRPVEVLSLPNSDGAQIGLRDRSNLSDVVLTMSRPALHILSLMDGDTTCDEIRERFHSEYGQPLSTATFQSLLDHLDEAHLLVGSRFDSFARRLQETYRADGLRRMPHADAYGVEDASGKPFVDMLAETELVTGFGRIRGLVAPHLDYARGRSCYGAAYGAIRQRECPQRVIILGTNHFGQSTSVVGTASAFETPLGRTDVDIDFLERIESRCGDLRTYELDHLREHSVELQVLWLQHLFGADAFTMVPFLCPDVCGPCGTASKSDGGLDFRDFVAALCDVLADDDEDTLIVAGADLSHVGAAFGDDRLLGQSYVDEVRRYDLAALDRLQSEGAEAFRQFLSVADNRTNICSAGCLYALAATLVDVKVTRLGYHQAVDQATQTCVTCAALVFSNEQE